MVNLQVITQLLSTAIILLSGPIVILLLALKKGNLQYLSYIWENYFSYVRINLIGLRVYKRILTDYYNITKKGGQLSGRASALQADGHWFESSTAHRKNKKAKAGAI